MVTVTFHQTCLIRIMLDMDVTIYRARLHDIPSIARLVNSAYRGSHSKIGWTTEADLLGGQRTDEEDLTKILNEPHNTILIGADEINRILGCVYLQKRDAVMYLGMLTVQPQLQANGLGKQLLFAAEEFARQKHCTVIEMTVISVRHELIAWYNRRGYRASGEVKPFPADGKFGVAKQPLEFIVLSKTL